MWLNDEWPPSSYTPTFPRGFKGVRVWQGKMIRKTSDVCFHARYHAIRWRASPISGSLICSSHSCTGNKIILQHLSFTIPLLFLPLVSSLQTVITSIKVSSSEPCKRISRSLWLVILKYCRDKETEPRLSECIWGHSRLPSAVWSITPPATPQESFLPVINLHVCV